MSKRVILLQPVPNLGARGLLTPPIPDRYAQVLIRRGLAKPAETKARKTKLAPEVKPQIAPEPQSEDFSDLKKKEIKERLDKLGIEFDSSAKKADLLALYIASMKE